MSFYIIFFYPVIPRSAPVFTNGFMYSFMFFTSKKTIFCDCLLLHFSGNGRSLQDGNKRPTPRFQALLLICWTRPVWVTCLLSRFTSSTHGTASTPSPLTDRLRMIIYKCSIGYAKIEKSDNQPKLSNYLAFSNRESQYRIVVESRLHTSTVANMHLAV